METNLRALAAHLRAMQLAYHKEHHLAKGPCFAADHELFGGFYGECEADFDQVVEWAVGLGDEECALPTEQMAAIHAVLELDLEELETQLRDICELIVEHKDCDCGLEQLVGTIDQRSNVRSYKLGRRAE